MARLKELSVFFPAYNEEANIENTVRKALEALPRITDTFELIIVNDGSTDRTADIAGRLAREFPRIKVITHPENRGYGAAVRSGLKASSYGHVFFTDGDGQFDIRELSAFAELAGEYDIVAGYRIDRQDPFYRLINAKAYNLLIRILFGLRVKDIDCAFKIIRKEVIDAIALESESQFVSAEFLIKARKKGYTIVQKGARHLPREHGVPTGNSPANVINSFRELFTLWKDLK
ncbi:MAG: glycosyltransferase [Candidatus Omnitrophica bacterium]|nr:glycosyltransferase [Candidatus Omnitrophota bacterium]